MVKDLNLRQLEAIQAIDGPLLVLAGAGSGKTRVITHKIAHLIRNGIYSAQQITAVTFTNKAAREMKTRAEKLLSRDQIRGLRVCTFHALGLEILRREHNLSGRKTNFSLFDATDSAALLRELLYKHADATNVDSEALHGRISAWKNALLIPAQVKSLVEDPIDVHAAALYATYQHSLSAYNAVDFDDLITLPVQIFQKHSETLEYWQRRIRYLLVDEYQDTNTAQYELVKLLVGIQGHLTVVGDDDQSIYAWRGARPENLAQLQQDFNNLQVIKLEQNYRSSGKILQAANRLIANNPHVFAKRLWSELGPGELIRVLSCRDETHEAEKVVAEILHQHFMAGGNNGNNSYGDYAILYRGNYQARPFEKALRELSIPYFISGGTSFFARSEIKDLMAYLRLLSNSEDDAAFLRIVNVPRREIGPSTLEKLATYAQERHSSLLAVCDEFGLMEHMEDRARWHLGQFAELMTRYSIRAEDDNPAQTVRDLIAELDYDAWIRETSSSPSTAERRLANIAELIDWLTRLRTGTRSEASLVDLVKRLTLFDTLERQSDGDGGDRVHLMTLHAAKGLEFAHVFLVGMEEELLPHRNSIETGVIEEERRLLYVGITRARRTLTLSLATRRRRGGENVICEPSRFIAELEDTDLLWIGSKSETAKEENRKRGLAHLAGLKELLAVK